MKVGVCRLGEVRVRRIEGLIQDGRSGALDIRDSWYPAVRGFRVLHRRAVKVRHTAGNKVPHAQDPRAQGGRGSRVPRPRNLGALLNAESRAPHAPGS